MKRKIILHVPHSSTTIPLTDGYVINNEAMAKEMLKLTDWYTDDLFDSDGASINIFPIERYVELNKEISFADLVYTAGKINQSAIGVKLESGKVSSHTEGVFLNPNKKMKITPKNGDQLIVISSSID